METINQIAVDEGGYQAEVYLCTKNKRTWLIGRNIEDRPITDDEWKILKDILQDGGTQKDWAEVLFDAEVDMVAGELQHNHNVDLPGLPENVRVIILNMAFNMGTSRFNPAIWPNFFRAVKNRDFKRAAAEMKNSRWYVQTKSRAKRLYYAMLTETSE